jgi:hypothetical protein
MLVAMRRLSLAASLAAVIASSAIAPPAAAQNAEALYDEGLQAMLAKNYADGCPKLQQSYDMDPALGALFTLAACYERWGKVHTAAQRYQTFLEQTAALPPAQAKKQEDRMKTGVAKHDELAKLVPTLTMSFATPPPDGVTVTLDDEVVASADLGQALSRDPGDFRVVVTAADGESRSYEESLATGENKTLSLEPPLAAAAAPVEDEPSDGSTTTTVAFVLGGVGIAALIAGGVTGGLVFAKKSDVDANCVGTVCTQEGKDAADEGQTLGMVSTVMFAVGGAALAGGVLLYLLAPDDSGAEQASRPGSGIRLTVASSELDPLSAVVGMKGSW